MGNLHETEFERRLFAAGQKLANPPRSIHGMLRALEKVEAYLSMVNQSPSESILNAMRPSKDALVTPELMRNRHEEVKLQVLNCLNKILKIMAPNKPFHDDLLKHILAHC